MSSTNVEINDQTKKQLVGSIYNKVDLTKFRYDMIRYENDLQKLLKQKYHLMINYCGTNCLFVFTKIKDKYFCFTVDRQTISYSFTKIDFQNVKMDMRKISLDKDIYEGTIFEGILVKRHGQKDLYIICDIYTFCGEDLSQTSLDSKLDTVRTYMNENYDKESGSNIELEVNKLYKLEQIEEIFSKEDEIDHNLKFRGLCFYPNISETKLIFLMTKIEDPTTIYKNSNKNKNFNFNKDKKSDEDEAKINGKVYKMEQEQSHQRDQSSYRKQEYVKSEPIKQDINEKKSKIKYINNTGKEVVFTLEVKPTDTCDVYKVFASEKKELEGRKVFKKILMGIALIPSTVISHKLQKLCKTTEGEGKSIMMKCSFNDEKNKWVPMEVDMTKKIPDLIQDIESTLDLVMDDDD